MPYPRTLADAGRLMRRMERDHADSMRRRFRDLPGDGHDDEWTRRWEQDFEQSERAYYRHLGEGR